MRKFCFALCFFAVVASAVAGQYVRQFTTRSMLLPPAGIVGGRPYAASTVYTNGTIVTNTSGMSYMVLDSGTTSSTNAFGPQGQGEFIDGSASFYRAVPDKSRRSMFLIKNISGGTATIQWGDMNSTTNNDGYPLEAGVTFGISEPECWQGAVWVQTTGSLLSVSEY